MKWNNACLHNLKKYRDLGLDWPEPHLEDVLKQDREVMVLRAEKNEVNCQDLWKEWMLKWFPVAYEHFTFFGSRPDLSKCAFKPFHIRKWKQSKKVNFSILKFVLKTHFWKEALIVHTGYWYIIIISNLIHLIAFSLTPFCATILEPDLKSNERVRIINKHTSQTV